MTTGGFKVWGYVRCSLVEQSEAMSLDTQRARIAAWAVAAGADLTEVIEDAGVSGSRPLADRPGGVRVERLLSSRRPGVDAVVVLRLDRLGRDAAESMRLFKEFRRGAVGLVSIEDRIDLGTPHGRAMAGVAAVFGELERQLIAARTSEAMAELRRQGKRYGTVPFGWDDLGGHLVSNRDEQQVVDEILTMRGDGVSFQRIANSLNAIGVRPKRAAAWSSMAVRSVYFTAPRLREALAA